MWQSLLYDQVKITFLFPFTSHFFFISIHTSFLPPSYFVVFQTSKKLFLSHVYFYLMNIYFHEVWGEKSWCKLSFYPGDEYMKVNIVSKSSKGLQCIDINTRKWQSCKFMQPNEAFLCGFVEGVNESLGFLPLCK